MSVSVVMTCFNEGDYIEAAVRSVLDQSRQDLIDRIVVMDDGSGPETLAVLRGLEGADPRLQIVYGPGGAGLALNRNRAIALCDSPYLAILDGDDLWRKDKLEKQVPLLDSDPAVGLVYSDYTVFWNTDLSTRRVAGVRDITAARDLTLTYFLNDPPIIPSTLVLRRAMFDAVGGFDASIKVFEDTDFFVRLSRVCRFALVDEPLLDKRNRASSLTGRRRALMAHHAFVAFKAGEHDPRLTAYAPRRLAERARKLGNQEYYGGEVAAAAGFYGLAVRLNPLDPLGWASWLLAAVGGAAGYRLLRPIVARRAAVLGR
jgi:glycosyltransferase involved in cell wall biosynthesis